MKPFAIAATLSDAVALATGFGAATKIAIGAPSAGSTALGAAILAPASLTLTPAEIRAALGLGQPRCFLSFGNTEALSLGAVIGPLIEALSEASGTGFLPACLATPWLGRTVYRGHLFQHGNLQSDLKRALAPSVDGPIAIIPHPVIAAGSDAIRLRLTALKEQGVRLALLDAIEEEHCGIIAEALARQPIIAGPAWLCPQSPAGETAIEPALPTGPIAILSGALHRQTLIQTAAARLAMPVLDLDFKTLNPTETARNALAWAQPHFGKNPFLISSAAPPDKILPNAPAAETLAAVAKTLFNAGIRNFVLNGNDTAAAILSRLGINQLTAGAAFAGLRWLKSQDINILIKPGSFGSKNLFLYEFEPQSRLNEPAE